MTAPVYDIVIVGGGIIGSATAYALMKADSTLKLAVIEPDPTYTRSSTALSVANARIQFSLKENIQVSRYALKVLENFEKEMAVDGRQPFIAYRREGNLFLIDAAGRPAAEAAFRLQQNLGCAIHWWAPDEIRRHYPLYEPGEMAAGTFGPQDGHFDAFALLMGYRAKASAMGAVYIKDRVTEILTAAGSVSGVRLGAGNALTAGAVVNAAGAWAAETAKTAGIELPVKPVKRQVFVLDTEVKPQTPLPLTILPSGLYFRSETGGLIVLGKSMSEDPEGFDFTWEEDRFLYHLWPELAAFVPAFEALKLVRGWAGLYAVNTLDGNAIVGQWPELRGFYLANGFSGHGVQQAPAVGRYLAERILGLPVSLDLSAFSPRRILEGRPLSESGLV